MSKLFSSEINGHFGKHTVFYFTNYYITNCHFVELTAMDDTGGRIKICNNEKTMKIHIEYSLFDKYCSYKWRGSIYFQSTKDDSGCVMYSVCSLYCNTTSNNDGWLNAK